MDEITKLKMIYEEAYNFLRDKVDEDILKKHLDYYHNCNPKSICDVFRQMVQSLKNKQGYSNFIADVEQMSDILQGYDPQKVIVKFGNKWEDLFKEFQIRYGKNYKMDIDNKRNAWVMYSKGVLSCASFLSNFKTIEQFDEFVRSFFLNEFTIAALPMLLEKEIFGFGFPLACDFLKELGYRQYGKPDVHLKDIFIALNLVESASDYEIFKKIVKIGLIVKQDPVIVDKIFWLIGSGKFHMSNISIGSHKSEFIDFIRSNT
ncbi:MAG: hypothetical protein C4526_00835 [Nitrospiraceae bacterium]|nr:MAG: hypothetical protein C4526_00835 [Nitrospiraceae bacterium]